MQTKRSLFPLSDRQQAFWTGFLIVPLILYTIETWYTRLDAIVEIPVQVALVLGSIVLALHLWSVKSVVAFIFAIGVVLNLVWLVYLVLKLFV